MSDELTKGATDSQLFHDLDAEASATEIESLCMQCHKNGTTRLLLTRIPHFKSVILMAFECTHCGLKNNEVQSGESIQEYGLVHQLRCTSKADLNRQIVRNNTASISIPEFEFTAPPATNSSLTTAEGLITRFIEDLAADQDQRKEAVPEVYQAIEVLLEKLRNALLLPEEDGETESPHAFIMVVDDPTGNSYVENLCAPKPDPKLAIRQFRRTREQMIQMGLLNAEADDSQWSEREKELVGQGRRTNLRKEMEAAKKVMQAVREASEANEIMTFPANCSSCNMPGDTRMQMVDIPHFQEVIIMSTTCEHCGFKSNEVKCGGAISDKAKRITLIIEDKDDLSRDILKSETSAFKIPELDLDMYAGTLGGRFTTIEGLLRQVHDELDRRIPFLEGDSAVAERRQRFLQFLSRLEEAADGKQFPLTLTLDDPMAHSYIQNIYAPDPDPNMTIEEYERTFEENEDLGLNDMIVENYDQTANTETA
ncbi:nucleolar zinc-finger protein [Coemansia sp. RSA 353]|nr:nucleolar zinc-finger protein [Coemansia sp. RSA 637]KAJ2191484.1 nucleolar zinc-finger protein [Coemansia sp. RSA 532]KAJ2194704.1 nucleolar zinc-finger protein [Coemansia sp. RSA 522]KAJ2204256.1 nucleolar zinc-finger protein [Coemansia sp. RSA 521]KAJ2296050.1 nucleolar zinc-finger protein [Coemansia sp. RSA 353]KAJ2534630.1 nucleolar zinc-finger protein [Coemansia sp. RSA 1935]KAJ2590772.1 nucleolar zinc-finger protein [Coemansia sp. RSA 1797]